MKSAALLMVGLFSLATTLPALADDAHHPEPGKPAATAPGPQAAPEQTVKQMKANVKKMQSQLDRLGKARSEAEARKIMAEHMQTMQANMLLAEGMAGMDCPMHGGKHDGGMGMMGGEGTGHEVMQQRLQQLEQRMDRMEQMNRQPTGK